MKTQYFIVSSIALAVMSGCASQQTPVASNSSLEESAEYQALLKSKSELEAQNQQLRDELDKKQTTNTVTSAENNAVIVQNTTSNTTSDLLPPNALPGHCYARVVIPEQYETQLTKVQVSPELETVEVTPAEYNMVDEEVLVSEEWEELIVVPATYMTVEEQVVIKEASTKLVKLPAEYETVEEKIVIRPAYTTWKKGRGPIEKLDEATGEIMCLVEVPEESKIVKKTVLVKPERTEEVTIPAEYKTITKQVVDVAAHTKTVLHPAVYETVKVERMVKAPEEIKQTVPATFKEVEQTVKVSDADMEWREILCETNTTSDVVAELQRALDEKGFQPGPIDGVYGWRTMSAVTRYQKANELATGQLTIQTLQHLGVANWDQ